jgi:hypothetical protein
MMGGQRFGEMGEKGWKRGWKRNVKLLEEE